MGRKKKVEIILPVGFPAVGTFTRYYHEGWYYGRLKKVEGAVAFVERPGKRDLRIPITDVEVSEKKGV